MIQTMKLTLCHMHVIDIVRHAGAKFEFWAGCYAQDGIALLVCVAINGFHPYTVYEWYKDGLKLGDEKFPVLYATASGNYLCRLLGTSDTFAINESRTFLVQPGLLIQ